jgi:WD40 repeat protein
MDQMCNRYEAAWRCGPTPLVDDFLADWDEPERSVLRRELLALEGHYRQRAREEQATPTSGEDAPVAGAGRVLGDYELLEEIARGGMGVVCKARQISLNRIVAVKMILTGQLASEEDVQRFQREAENAAGLDHAHIVPIYEVGEHEGQHFFAMKFIEGGSLGQTKKRFINDPRGAAELMRLVAEAVHHAHQRGILHRDLKPANVLIDAQGQPHVTDFGLAKRLQSDAGQTQSGAIVGTPNYMAPEQAAGHGKRLTTAADVYGLGAVLYELLTGRPPFKAATQMETLMQVLQDEPVPLRQLNAQVPADLETICLKCLQKEPGKRYASAADLVEELCRFEVGEPIAARRAGTWERCVKWLRRHPAWAALAGVGVVAVLALVGAAVGLVYNAQLETVNTQLQNTSDQLEITNSQLRNTFGQLEAEKNEADRQRTEAERLRGLAQRYLYTAQMALVDTTRKEGKSERMLELLELHVPTPEHPEDLRRFEWYYLLRLCRPGQLPLRGHTAEVLGVAVSPDGRRAVSAGADQTVRLWDLVTRKEVLTLRAHAAEVTGVAFSQDGRLLASASRDGTVRVYDAVSGRETACCTGQGGPVLCVAFSPDGCHLASGTEDRTIKLWDSQTGGEVHRLAGHVGRVNAIAFSPDGRYLASGGAADPESADAIVRVWDWAAERETLELVGNRGQVWAVAFSSDGKRLAAGSGPVDRENSIQEGKLTIWDAATGQLSFFANEPAGTLRGVSFSPDGKCLATGNRGGSVKLWDCATKKFGSPFRGHTAMVTTVAFSSDGKRLVSAGADRTLRVWEVGPDPEPIALEHKGGPLGVFDVAFSPDGRCLASINEQTIKMWDSSTGQVLQTISGGGRARLAFSPDGKYFAAGGRVWEFGPGQLLTEFKGTLGSPNAYGVAFTFGPNIVTAEGRGRYSVAFSPDGKWLARGAEDHSVKLFDWAKQQEVHTFRDSDSALDVYALTFSPDGQRLAAATGDWQNRNPAGEVKVWDVTTRREIFTLRGHTEAVWGVAFSRDGTRLASCSGLYSGRDVDKQNTKPGEIKLWDAITGLEVLTLRGGHQGLIFNVAFSPDGKRLASAGADGFVKIWDAFSVSVQPGPVAAPLN